VPFNIASTALLTHILAKTTNLKPGEIIVNFGNAHVYSSHFEQVQRQLKRETFRFPKLEIKKDLESLEDIERLTSDDLVLKDYHCWPGIKAPMAV